MTDPEPEYLTVSELAKKLDLTVQAVSNRVGKLEALGLISRRKATVRASSYRLPTT